MIPRCRFCDTPLTHTFVDLGMSPISNSYLSVDNCESMEPFFPLHVRVCSECYLVQLPEFEPPDRIFNNDYAYFSSYSTTWLEHCQQYVEKVTALFNLGTNSFVIEIASNDGYLLQYFMHNRIPVLGIEPASNTADVAIQKGIPTLIKFFGKTVAQELADQDKQADLLLGNNVLAHVPDINDFVQGMWLVLKPQGVITMEFPHLLQLMQNNQFDTIYHEHFSYLSMLAVQRIFASHALKVYDVEELPTHGGSLRIYACHQDNARYQESVALRTLLTREREAGLHKMETYAQFAEKVHEAKRALLELLIRLRQAGKKIVGYGAPAKGNTLLNYCGIRQDFLEYTVDRSPQKQGKFLPGTHIPIFAPQKIAETKPDYVLILPWNLTTEIVHQMSYVREWGGRFIVPVPRPEIVS